MRNLLLVSMVFLLGQQASAYSQVFECKGKDIPVSAKIDMGSKEVTLGNGKVFKVRPDDEITKEEEKTLGELIRKTNAKGIFPVLAQHEEENGENSRLLFLLTFKNDEVIGKSFLIVRSVNFEFSCSYVD